MKVLFILFLHLINMILKLIFKFTLKDRADEAKLFRVEVIYSSKLGESREWDAYISTLFEAFEYTPPTSTYLNIFPLNYTIGYFGDIPTSLVVWRHVNINSVGNNLIFIEYFKYFQDYKERGIVKLTLDTFVKYYLKTICANIEKNMLFYTPNCTPIEEIQSCGYEIRLFNHSDFQINDLNGVLIYLIIL